jgi:hypothetical protein
MDGTLHGHMLSPKLTCGKHEKIESSISINFLLKKYRAICSLFARNTAHRPVSKTGLDQVAITRRQFAYHPRQALHYLLNKKPTVE